MGTRKPIKLKWVDTDKGSRYRSRLCAKEFRQKAHTWFAGTPPHESLRVLAALLAQGKDKPGNVSMAVLDVSRAHFHAPAERKLFVELPPEDDMASNPAYCGELAMSMYGTRDAAYNWEKKYSQVLTDLLFEKGGASPCHLSTCTMAFAC